MIDLNNKKETSEYISKLEKQVADLERTIEGTLIESQSKLLDQIFEHSLNSIVLLDKDYNFIRVSRTYAEACKRDLSDFPGKNHFDFYPSDLKDEFDEIKKTKMIYSKMARPFIFPDHPEWGTTYWNLELVPILDQEGEIELFLFTLKDVTKHTKTEEELRQALIFIDTALDAQQDTFFLFDSNSAKAIRWNQSFRNITGYTEEEIAELPAVTSYYSTKDLERARAFIPKVWDDGVGTIELELICKDGRKIPFEYRVSTILNHESKAHYIISIGRDISERRKAEDEKNKLQKEYNQIQKVESIGKLAGGVAHDFNNLLIPILGYSEILLEDLSDDNESRKAAREILNAGLRARDLVRQLLAFSRKQTLEYKPVNMNDIIKNFEPLLRRTIRKDVKLEIITSPKMENVLADVGQIEQVFMNLAINAADAMPSGGDLTLQISQVDLSKNDIAKKHNVEPGSYIMLTVSDTGCGMDDETRTHIFEPFYSTKGVHGTGLGLATVYGIIKQHNGNIQVSSHPNKGTTFKIYLPVSNVAHIQDNTKIREPSDIKGCETILLAEDNKSVRDLIAAILSNWGYTVLVAENGCDALNILREYNDTIHLLLTDLIMPEMNGQQLFAKASKNYPNLKVLYMSGYIDNTIINLKMLGEKSSFIQKPFKLKSLGNKIRKVLEGSSGNLEVRH